MLQRIKNIITFLFVGEIRNEEVKQENRIINYSPDFKEWFLNLKKYY